MLTGMMPMDIIPSNEVETLFSIVALILGLSMSAYISLYLPISPYISLYLPISPEQLLATLYLPTSPYISLYLPISPARERGAQARPLHP